MPDFFRVLNAIRKPDIAVYRTGRAIKDLQLRLYAANAERRRDRLLGGQLTDRLVKAFVANRSPFFVDLANPPKYGNVAHLLSLADQICAHQVDILGSGPTQLGDDIDWHRDAVSGYRWPNTLCVDLNIAGAQGADITWVWRLSCFQFLPSLAIAEQVTDDRRYRDEAIRLIQHWIENNPVYLGPNWTSPANSAIRACNWLYWWRCVKSRHEVSESFIRRFYASLLTHGRYIIHNLERHPVNTNNHYLADLAGLAYLGLLLPEDRETREWAIFAHKELEKQIWRQFLPDGVNFEASIPYHRLALELITYPALLFRLNGFDLSYEFWRHLERAFEYVAAYSPVHGQAPQIGDNDNGRLHAIIEPFTSTVNDHRYLLDIASSIFPDNPSFTPYRETTTEAPWFVSGLTNAPATMTDPATPSSKAFTESGIYVLRGKSIHCLVDCGPIGQSGKGGHAHNDTLSFVLSVGQHRVIIDSGTGTYFRSLPLRNLFRSTAVHNSVRVGGIEINDIPKKHIFRLASHDRPKVLSWSTNGESDRLAACHYGYTKLMPPVVHLRTIELTKSIDHLSVTDRFLTNGGHTVEWNIPLDPTASCEVSTSQQATVTVGDTKIKIIWHWEPDRIEVVPTQHSEAYGHVCSNQTLRLTTDRPDGRSYEWEISTLSAG